MNQLRIERRKEERIQDIYLEKHPNRNKEILRVRTEQKSRTWSGVLVCKKERIEERHVFPTMISFQIDAFLYDPEYKQMKVEQKKNKREGEKNKNKIKQS